MKGQKKPSFFKKLGFKKIQKTTKNEACLPSSEIPFLKKMVFLAHHYQLGR